MTSLCNECTMQSLQTTITTHPFHSRPPLPYPADRLLHLPTDPPLAPANFPTSQQIDNPTNRKVGKLANTTNPKGQGRAAHQSPNAANPTTLHPALPGGKPKNHPLHSPPAPKPRAKSSTACTKHYLRAHPAPTRPPTFQQVGKLASRKVGTQHQGGRAGELPPPNAAKRPTLYPNPYTLAPLHLCLRNDMTSLCNHCNLLSPRTLHPALAALLPFPFTPPVNQNHHLLHPPTFQPAHPASPPATAPDCAHH